MPDLPVILEIIILILSAVVAALLYVIYRLRQQLQHVSLGLDEVTEDALKNLYHLAHAQGTAVRPSNLIRLAGLQPGRFPAIQAELILRGWARLEQNNLLLLPAGEKRAIELVRAHRLWERYLVDKEGLPLDAVHNEATRREHTVSADEVDRLEAQLGYPAVDPHGDPIPRRDGTIAQPVRSTPLSDWPSGRLGQVVHVEDEPPALFTQLALLGLTPGAQVEVDEHTPGRVLVWSGGQRLALAPAVAALVSVADEPAETRPLSEIEVGQAARITGFSQVDLAGKQWQGIQLSIGDEIAAVRADPLGDPVIYRIDGREISLTRIQANRIAVDRTSLREFPLPPRPWLSEEIERARELFQRYGSWTVIKQGLLFLGPAFVVSVGYMDPGNWGTDIEGGARFGYALLWVILLANLMAILLQTLSSKLGIATGKTLPEVCREQYPPWASVTLWVTAELAAIATDLAEFLGGAVGFYLLFGIPLFPAALLTGVIISLILLLERYGMRKVEMVIIGMISVIGLGYMLEIWLVKPPMGAVFHGLLVPSIPLGATLVAVGIIGATVMPHNLYLHSALIQTRVRPSDSLARKKSVYRLSIIDSFIALNGAFLVNAAILIMSAAAFSGDKLPDYSLEAAHKTLVPLLGPLAGAAFAIALLASGLASSATATMAGQVIMDGFIHHRINVWLRRLITMIPSLIVIGLGIEPIKILVWSQVSLSFQLPFAVIPLVLFTSNPKIMGEFTNNRVTTLLAWVSTAVIIGLNVILVYETVAGGG